VAAWPPTSSATSRRAEARERRKNALSAVQAASTRTIGTADGSRPSAATWETAPETSTTGPSTAARDHTSVLVGRVGCCSRVMVGLRCRRRAGVGPGYSRCEGGGPFVAAPAPLGVPAPTAYAALLVACLEWSASHH
jgi:hypothetical protein